MDADTRELLRGSIRALLKTRPGDLLAGLDELGWADVVSDDEEAAVGLLFTEQGRAGAVSAALDAVVTAAGGGDLRNSDPAEPPAVVHPIGRARCTADGVRLYVDGVVLREPGDTDAAVVATAADESTVRMLAPAQWVSSATLIGGFDPASSLHCVRLEIEIDEVQECKCDWTAAIAAGRRALASELVGNGQAMLEIAVEQVGQRTQFGRPIGANQTPRHRLAESYALLAAADELVHVAWVSRSPWDALVAKTYAGYASETTSRVCVQVCGAVGLTLEHALGGYVKRARILDALYGGWHASVHDIGMQLLDSRTVPQGSTI